MARDDRHPDDDEPSAAGETPRAGAGDAHLTGRATVTMLPDSTADTRQSTVTTHGGNARLFAGQLPQPRDTDDKYVRGDDLGQGGMGDVVRCLDLDLRRSVAMKVLRRMDSPARYARFLEEAQVTGQLEHPNIVPVHDIGLTADGRPFFTMKLVKGKALDRILDEALAEPDRIAEEYPLPRLIGALIGVCNAIAYAHEHGVVHRDLKPGNIMLGGFGEVLVMDWGLAKLGKAKPGQPPVQSVREDLIRRARLKHGPSDKVLIDLDADADAADIADGTLTQDGSVLGTPVYMPPEQARGDLEAIDERTDIYSLGAILYEILTLQPPVDGETAQMVLARVRAGRIEPPSRRAPDRVIPRELEAVAMQALAKDPRQRYQRVTDLRQDLERYLTGHAVSAKDDSLWESLVKLVKRNRTAAVATAAGLVALTITITVAFMLVLGYWRGAQNALDELRAEQDRRTQLQDRITKENQRFWHEVHHEYLDRTLFERWHASAGWTQNLNSDPLPLTAEQRLTHFSLQGSGLRISLDESNAHLAYNEHISGSVRLRYSFTVKRDDSGGTHCVLGGHAWNVGYVFQIGGWQNSDRQRTAVLRGDGRHPRLLAQHDFVPEAERTYQVEASMERRQGGAVLTLRIDGQTILQAEDPDPLLEVREQSNVALWWGAPSAVLVHRVIIDRLGEPLKTDLLEVAARHLAKANYDTALDLYQEVYVSSTDEARRQQADQGLQRTHLARSHASRVKWWRKRLGKPWPASAWSLELHEGVVTCYLGGDQITDLRPLRGIPINRLTLDTTALTNLDGIAELPLTHLTMLGGFGLKNLDALAGLQLRHLQLEGHWNLTDITALRGMPLQHLQLIGCANLTDLSPLSGAPLRYLDLSRCQSLADLRPVVNSDLRVLKVSSCPNLVDLSPLQFAPVEHLVLDRSHLAQASLILRYHPSLQTIAVASDYAYPVDEFWAAYDHGMFDD
ncbi:MAG: protein kinase domain-containing protein [Planctomycetota bacterium]